MRKLFKASFTLQKNRNELLQISPALRTAYLADAIMLHELIVYTLFYIIQRTFYCCRNIFNRQFKISPALCTTYLADAIMLHEHLSLYHPTHLLLMQKYF